jgi:type IV secretory pathway TrbF-like protein
MNKLNLIEDWKSAWRFVSVNCMVGAAALQGAWVYIPADMKSSLPPNVVTYVTIALLVIGVVGRLTKQKPVEPAP